MTNNYSPNLSDFLDLVLTISSEDSVPAVFSLPNSENISTSAKATITTEKKSDIGSNAE